eukprot:13297370-Heterocapsa_arctica.AAC.1
MLCFRTPCAQNRDQGHRRARAPLWHSTARQDGLGQFTVDLAMPGATPRADEHLDDAQRQGHVEQGFAKHLVVERVERLGQ